MSSVVYRPGDPHIYLHAMGRWYCYNSKLPPIGGGAMGDVYAGVELDAQGRAVRKIAVKRVKDGYANNKMVRDRARMEASLTFRHPNLVEMIGCCATSADSGPIFLLSHFVEGATIDQYVAQMGSSPTRVEKISLLVCHVLDALDYLHMRGVVHRDIKPSNIMIEDTPNGPNVRLMDLGIARFNSGNQFSIAGFIGTPEYSAPEQIQRDENSTTDEIGAPTDIYELGITFYELLSGHNPMRSTIDAETLSRQMSQLLPPCPQRIPPRLMRVIAKATEKDPSRRYQTATQFHEAISQALLPPPPLGRRLAEWCRSNKLAVGAIAAVSAVIIAALVAIIILI